MKHLLFLLLFPTVLFAQHPDDYRWDGRFDLPGVSFPESLNGANGITAMAATPNYIVAAGQFTVPGKNIALWNKRTNSWEKAGEGIIGAGGNFDTVSGIDAKGDSVVIWGNIILADGKPTSQIAILNVATKEWQTDTMMDGHIYSVVRHGSDVICSGYFSIKGTSIKNIARWNGSVWQAFGTDTLQRVVSDMSVLNNRLFGLLRMLPTDAASSLVEWNGAVWEKVLDTIKTRQNTSTSLAVAGNYLYLYGGTDSIKPVGKSALNCGGIIRFDGTTWDAIADTVLLYSGLGIIGSISGFGEDLYVAGEFLSVNGIEAARIARWNSKTRRWSALGSGVNESNNGKYIRGLVADTTGVYVGGLFDVVGSQFVNNIAYYSLITNGWSALAGSNTFAPNQRANVFADKGQLIVTGDFEYAGHKQVNYIASWNGHEWAPLGSGILGGTGKVASKPSITFDNKGINHCIRYHDTLHLAGLFEHIGSSVCGNITRFDAGRFQCLDNGVVESYLTAPPNAPYYYSSFITGLAVIGNNLFVSGNFSKAGTIAANCIAQWDGHSWSALGKGATYDYFDALKLQVDSTGGLLLCGGFTEIDGLPCHGLARWDGIRWIPVGYSANEQQKNITALCVAPNNDIYIGGDYFDVPDKRLTRVAKWNGVNWQNLGELRSDASPHCATLAIKGDSIYIAGQFNGIGGVEAKNVAVMNIKTLEWTPLGSGLTPRFSGTINSIAFIGDTVYFGGEIAYAGEKPSFNIAAWLPAKPSAVEQLSTEPPTTIALTFSPNPASTNATFNFYLEKSSSIRLVLADALGREVMTIAEGTFATGAYRAAADVSLLPAGVYYTRLYTTHGTTSQAAVITR